MERYRNPKYVSLPTLLVALFVGDIASGYVEQAGVGIIATALTYMLATALGVFCKRVLFNWNQEHLGDASRVHRLPHASSAQYGATEPSVRYRRTFS